MPRLFKPSITPPAVQNLQRQASNYIHATFRPAKPLTNARILELCKKLDAVIKDKNYRNLTPYIKKRVDEALDNLLRKIITEVSTVPKATVSTYDSTTESDWETEDELSDDEDELEPLAPVRAVQHIEDLPALESFTYPVMVQIPSGKDVTRMRGMIAGIDEDQAARIGNMTRLMNHYPELPTVTTDTTTLNLYWNDLFQAIDRNESRRAATLLSEIPDDDIIMKPLLAVHTRAYLKKLMLYSISAHRKGLHELNDDVVVTPKTFELLIRDLATSILIPSKVCFSFGLPSHHAFSDRANGFCLINKTAVMMQHMANTSAHPIKFVIIGLDVNRDDGLSNVLREQLSHLDITHIDVFDSRVYPMDGSVQIDEEFGVKKARGRPASTIWQKNGYTYHAQDLSQKESQKTPDDVNKLHPAIGYALTEAKIEIKQAIHEGKKVAILLPTGWDSHCEETANCSRLIDDDLLTKEEAALCRFNDRDFGIFNYMIMTYFRDYREHISHLYWGLEGGYERQMYERQTTSLLEAICQRMVAKPVAEASSSPNLEDDEERLQAGPSY